MNIKNAVKIFVISAMSIILFNSCGDVEIEEVEAPLYSREYVETMVSGIGFGYGSLDASIVMLDYVYNDSEIAQLYGDDFEISSSGMNGTSDLEHAFIQSFVKGTSQYEFVIKGDKWVACATKSYFGKWEVTDCYLCDE